MTAGQSTAPRVGIFRGPQGVRSFSMDGYADSMSASLRAQCAGFASIEQVRQPDREGGERIRRFRAAGRLSEFVSRYPRYLLQARSTRFSLNHVMDHAFGHLAYVLDPRRTVVTCHDIFPLKRWKGAIRGMERRVTPPVTVIASLSGLRRARAVVTTTQATKQDLVSLVGVDPARIHVIPYGLDRAFQPLVGDRRADAANRYPLAGDGARYILAVDTGPAYKNQRATIEVLARARARSDADVRLVRVGPALRDAERERARRYGVDGFILELGPQPREEMAAIYSRTQVLLFPSFYEGFGWPPLEAMACGIPVVSSRAAAVDEAVGGAALQADAEDYDGLTSNVLAALTDQATSRRLVELGRVRAAAFTWDRAALEVADLYRLIMKECGI